jgi:hypothetical protein
MSNTNRPLWQVMHDSYIGSPGTRQEGYAAELRAIAEDADQHFDDYAPAYKVISWLRAEAGRAEAGE